MKVCFCCYTSIQYDWRSHWVVYFELANDNFSFAVYSDKICSYEKICKATKKVMDDFINDSQKYARWFGDTIGGVREVKLLEY